MTGLMLKDMYSLRTYFLKQLALMTVLYLAISVGLMKNFSFLSPMLTMSVLDSFTYRNGFLEIAASTGGVIVVYMLVTVFMLPLFFKLGAEKARVAMTLCFILPFLLIVWGFSWLGDGAAAFVESLPWPMIATVGGLILVLLCAASFFVSVKFYESKEY